ncbi:SsgA family sporulation/cell division regulator [Streptomyces sp. NPDC048623]|uniref:SsgA family sporulation/cell division regulator n=1 Tax=Streptomyces sp. NPDC048623 TaxID=3155761 RepID=UPI0034293D80
MPELPDCTALLTLAAVVHQDLTRPVAARLRYHRSDPYAVHLDHHVDLEQPVTWAISRELLTDGLTARVGLGDVSVHPSPGPADDTLSICLSPPGGTLVLRAPRSLVRTFLKASYAIVPAGGESAYYDMDELLSRFWSREAPSAG